MWFEKKKNLYEKIMFQIYLSFNPQPLNGKHSFSHQKSFYWQEIDILTLEEISYILYASCNM